MSDNDLYTEALGEARRPIMYMPCTTEMLADADVARRVWQDTADRHFRPWRYPDRNPMPHIDLFPAATKTLATLREARSRLTTAVDILRYGAP